MGNRNIIHGWVGIFGNWLRSTAKERVDEVVIEDAVLVDIAVVVEESNVVD
jgi:DNA gyrase inhibitor GyrI